MPSFARLPALPVLVALGALVSPTAFAADAGDWRPLFNGRDLSGWANVNAAPDTFTVRDGRIASTGVPIGLLRTDRQYENFEIELEWRHLRPGGNAGLFVWSWPVTAPGTPFARAIEVQILDGRNTDNYTSHGDVFAIHGASFKPDRPHPGGWMRCLPSEQRVKPAPEWNHYRVHCSNGVVQLAVNGKVVSGGSAANPRKGYICLESEGSPAEFRNVRLREFPSSGVPPAETAPVAGKFRPLYTGVDFAGWRFGPAQAARWRTNDWRLESAGPATNNARAPLWTEQEFGDFRLIADWRLAGKPEPKRHPVVLASGQEARNDDGTPKLIEVPDAGAGAILLRGSPRAAVHLGCRPVGSGEVPAYREDPQQPESVRAGVTPRLKADAPIGQWNRVVITLRGDRVTVVLNDKTVLENASLPGLSRRGPIGLQHTGAPIQFASVLVEELDPE